MSCEDYQELLSPYLDKALTQEEERTLEKHLQGCACCRESLEVLKNMMAHLKVLEEINVPEHFHQEMMQKVMEEPRGQNAIKQGISKGKHKIPYWMGYVSSLTAVCLLGLFWMHTGYFKVIQQGIPMQETVLNTPEGSALEATKPKKIVSKAMPPKSVIPEATKEEATALKTIQPNAIQPNTIQPNTIQPNTIPANNVPLKINTKPRGTAIASKNVVAEDAKSNNGGLEGASKSKGTGSSHTEPKDVVSETIQPKSVIPEVSQSDTMDKEATISQNQFAKGIASDEERTPLKVATMTLQEEWTIITKDTKQVEKAINDFIEANEQITSEQITNKQGDGVKITLYEVSDKKALEEVIGTLGEVILTFNKNEEVTSTILSIYIKEKE